jgi:hypothetical protein
MNISSHLPWPLKIAAIALVLGLGGALAMWTYDLGRGIPGIRSGSGQAAVLQQQLAQLTRERDQLLVAANISESNLTIERSAKKQLAEQARILESDNAKLKEDLAFFEGLLPAGAGPGAIAIRRLTVELVAPNQLRYRLLMMQGGKGEREFTGNLQLAVTVTQGGKNATMLFPDAKSAEPDKYRLGFKHYQRLEGVLTLPDGATAKAIQARILEKGQLRAQQSANL